LRPKGHRFQSCRLQILKEKAPEKVLLVEGSGPVPNLFCPIFREKNDRGSYLFRNIIEIIENVKEYWRYLSIL